MNKLKLAKKNWLKYALNHLAQPMSVTSSVYLLAIVVTPIDCAYNRPCVFCSYTQVPGSDHQVYAYIAVLGPAMFKTIIHVCSAVYPDAKL